MTVDLLTAKLIENKHMGFDELALLCGVEKSRIKEVWNMLDLGLKKVPRTLPTLKPVLGKDYELTEELVFFLSPIESVVIPSRFTTDLGSVPTFLRWLIDKDDRRFLSAFILHDFRYITQFKTRGEADHELREIAKSCGAQWFVRSLVFWGVRIGGWIAWYNNKKKTSHKNYVVLLTNKATTWYLEKKDHEHLSLKYHNV